MTRGDRERLRAELAGKAMQGMLSDEKVLREQLAGEPEDLLVNQIVAKEAVAFADALLAELERTEEPIKAGGTE